MAAAGSQPGCVARTIQQATCPVGSYGSNTAGLSDMVGKVWELTEDCWDGDCTRRVIRWRLPARRSGPRSGGHSVALRDLDRLTDRDADIFAVVVSCGSIGRL